MGQKNYEAQQSQVGQGWLEKGDEAASRNVMEMFPCHILSHLTFTSLVHGAIYVGDLIYL